MPKADKIPYCSFCGRDQQEVLKLIAGPSVFICEKCTDLCIEVVLEEIGADMAKLKTMPNLQALVNKAKDRE